MNTALAVSGAAGGLVVFCGGVWAMVRGIVRQAAATEGNSKRLDQIDARLDRIEGRQDNQDQRLSRLEGWRRR